MLLSSSASYHSCHECPSETACEEGKCRHTQSYSEGSTWTSSSFSDLVYLPEAHMSSLFCIETQTGLFLKQKEDGILGLSWNSDFLNSLNNPAFSLCFTPEAGYIVFGGNSEIGEKNLNRQVEIKPTGYYTLPVISVHLGSIDLQCRSFFNRGKGTVLDSGTTDTYLPLECASSFREAWREATGREFSNEVQSITHEEFHKFPVLSFALEGDQVFEIHARWVLAIREASAVNL